MACWQLIQLTPGTPLSDSFAKRACLHIVLKKSIRHSARGTARPGAGQASISASLAEMTTRAQFTHRELDLLAGSMRGIRLYYFSIGCVTRLPCTLQSRLALTTFKLRQRAAPKIQNQKRDHLSPEAQRGGNYLFSAHEFTTPSLSRITE